jgi:predicted dehydrogenase
MDARSSSERSMDPVRIGVIGCGNISGTYLKNCRELPEVEVVACADIDLERARARAGQFDIPAVCTPAEIVAHEDIDIILNLTVPGAHASVSIEALQGGKHVYSEKPLATTRADGRRMLVAAADAQRRVGCAPDTFLGAGLQTARKLLDEGAIGTPVGATAFTLSRGMEHWHPNPEFFYQPGAGPLFDMGPYYLTALVALLGPVQSVTGMARISFPVRTIGGQIRAGTTFTVSTPTYVAGLLQFTAGPVGTLISTFDVHHHSLPFIEVYGSEGTMRVPDPNRFGGSVQLRRGGDPEWHEAVSDSPYTTNWRGLGLADMARALRTGDVFRATGDLGFHVLDIMEALLTAARDGQTVTLESTVERPAPMTVSVSIS